MKQRRIDWLAAGIVFVITLILYIVTASPTVAFWDCGEFIACAHILGVPHPPGTPLFVLIGRLFSLIPFAREIAFRINFISIITGALAAAIAVLLTSRVIRGFKFFKTEETEKWIPTVAGVVGGLFITFGFSVWDNSLEAEVYSISTCIGFMIVYLAVMWRERIEPREALATASSAPLSGNVAPGKAGILSQNGRANALMLLVLYMVILAAGIHLTPVMMLFAVIPFVMIVNHRLLPTFFLGVLGLAFMLFEPGWPQLAVVALFVIYFFTQRSSSRRGLTPAWLFLGAYALLIILAALRLPWPVILLGVAVLLGAFIYAGREYKVDMTFFWMGAILIVIGFSVQFYLMVRAHSNPSINMVDPIDLKRFLSVLHREQYGRATVESQLWPRKTVVDPDTGQPTGLGAIAGIFWQFVMYFKYFFWQWGLQDLSGKSVLTVILRVLVASVPTVLGVFGLYSLAKRDRKLFWFLLTTFLLSSAALVIYLNMRFPHSGPLPKGFTNLPQEVRERDYFYTFSYAFWGLFTGFGLFEIIASLRQAIKRKKVFRIVGGSTSGVVAGVALVAGLINLPMLTRQGDWIPLEYGFNLLASCREPSVMFTNGDNDTFPLWFVQEVPSTAYEDGKRPYKPGVINANLSLLNTPWYIEHLKRKGAPISFAYESKNERVALVYSKDKGWVGLLAHPSIKSRTLEFELNGQKVKADKRGNLMDASRRMIGQVDTLTGLVTLNVAPAAKENGLAYIVASYGSGEIDNLPPYVILGRNQVIMLADLMIRDMIATNAGKVYADSEKVLVSGFTTKIPRDYLLPTKMFIDNVLKDYKETVMPVYFSTTVSPSRVQEFGPYLIEEGLAYRFRKAPPEDSMLGRPAIDLDRSVHLFTKEFKMRSILDPKVRRDEQARGLFINYGVAMQEIGEQIAMKGNAKAAYEFVKPVARFEVDPEVRRVFLLNLYMFASQAGDVTDAETYRAELEAKGWLGGDFYIRQGIGFLRRGDTLRAEQELKKAYASATRENYQPFLSLFLFYTETMRDTAKAQELLDAWDRRFPGHEVSFRLYLDYLKNPRKAIGILDDIVRQNPNEPGLIQFRDSLKRAYNL